MKLVLLWSDFNQWILNPESRSVSGGARSRLCFTLKHVNFNPAVFFQFFVLCAKFLGLGTNFSSLVHAECFSSSRCLWAISNNAIQTRTRTVIQSCIIVINYRFRNKIKVVHDYSSHLIRKHGILCNSLSWWKLEVNNFQTWLNGSYFPEILSQYPD